MRYINEANVICSVQAIIEKYRKDEIATGFRLEQPVWRGDRLPAIVLRSIEGQRAPDEDIYSALSAPDCALTAPPAAAHVQWAALLSAPTPAPPTLDLAVLRACNRDAVPLGLFSRRTLIALNSLQHFYFAKQEI